MRKVVCPSCNELVEIEEDQTIAECPHCKESHEVKSYYKNTENFINVLLMNANKYVENAYSYEEAYKCYKTVLELVPEHLDSILGMEICLLKTSSLKNNVFDKFINEFNSHEINLEKTTYIRLGHFFEQTIDTIFKYQNSIINFLANASDEEKEICYYNLIGVIKVYDFVLENISIFSEEEYKDSIFISLDEIKTNKDKLLSYMKDLDVYKGEFSKPDELEICFNNKKIKYNEFNIENYPNVNDYAFFKVISIKGQKFIYYIFAMLIILFIGMTVGLILSLMANTKIAGYIILGICAGLFILTYAGFHLYRKKIMKEING